MTDDRESFRVARIKGKAKAHEKRLAFSNQAASAWAVAEATREIVSQPSPDATSGRTDPEEPK